MKCSRQSMSGCRRSWENWSIEEKTEVTLSRAFRRPEALFFCMPETPLENEKTVYYNTIRRLIAFNLITEISVLRSLFLLFSQKEGIQNGKD